jgi:hypothetical protein
MLAAVQRLFAAPVFAGDERRTQQARLFNLSYWFCTGWMLLVLLGNVAGNNVQRLISVMLGIAVVIGVVPYLSIRRGRLEDGVLVWLVYSFLVATFGMATLGTMRAPSLGFYLILVMCAGLVFGGRAMIVMVVASSLAVAGLIVAQNRGLLPVPDYSVGITQWITATAFFVCAGGMMFGATKVIRESLERAEREVEERRRTEEQLRETNRKLEDALHSVKTLKGLLPICAWCHKVREDEGYWSQLESYISAHTDTTFTHGICPECKEKNFGMKPECKKA